MKEFLLAFKRWDDFKGRSTRREYWMFILFFYILLFLMFIIDTTLLKTITDRLEFGVLTVVYYLIAIIPSISLTARRLHDANYSSWLMLLNFIPFASIAVFVLTLLDSYPCTNQWGENPKGVANSSQNRQNNFVNGGSDWGDNWGNNFNWKDTQKNQSNIFNNPMVKPVENKKPKVREIY